MSHAFQVGEVVLYIPGHAQGDPLHPDVELGVVTRVAPSGTVLVRYAVTRLGAPTMRFWDQATDPADLLLLLRPGVTPNGTHEPPPGETPVP